MRLLLRRLRLALLTLGVLLPLLSNLRHSLEEKAPTESLPVESTAPPPAAVEAPTRPYFIFHVGPPKTATTSIQAHLTAWADVLQQDHYVYAGSFYESDTTHYTENHTLPWAVELKKFQCQRQLEQARVASNRTGEYWTNVTCIQNVQNAIPPGRHIIISDETLSFQRRKLADLGKSPIDWIGLQDAFSDYQILVVVAYRRFYEWLPSSKQQMDRYTPAKKKLTKWPSQGGLPLTPYTSLLDRQFPNPSVPYVPPSEVTQYWQPHVAVKYLNLHHSHQALLVSLACHVLPSAPHTCRHAQSMGDERQYNPQLTLNYDFLALAAVEAEGLVDPKLQSRRSVNRAIARYTNESSTFPLQCPNETEYARLYERSWEMEVKALGEEAANETDHRAGFDRMVASQKNCWVDTAAVLAQPEWQAFFRRVQEEKRAKSPYERTVNGTTQR